MATQPQAEAPEADVETTGTETPEKGDHDNPEVDELLKIRTEMEGLRKQLSKVNNEAASKRKKADDLEAELERYRTQTGDSDQLKKKVGDLSAKLSEAERSAQEWADELARTRRKHAIQEAARTAGFRYPETVFRLVDRPESIEIDDEGEVSTPAVKEVVDKLAKKYPDMLGEAQQKPRTGTPPREGPRRSAPPPGSAAALQHEAMKDELRQSAGYVM